MHERAAVGGEFDLGASQIVARCCSDDDPASVEVRHDSSEAGPEERGSLSEFAELEEFVGFDESSKDPPLLFGEVVFGEERAKEPHGRFAGLQK